MSGPDYGLAFGFRSMLIGPVVTSHWQIVGGAYPRNAYSVKLRDSR